MFNVGGGEMIMLGILALMVFGPKDLPRIVQKVVRTVRALRTAASDFQTEVTTAIKLENERQDQASRQRKPLPPDPDEAAVLDSPVAPEPIEDVEKDDDVDPDESLVEVESLSEPESEVEPVVEVEAEESVGAEEVAEAGPDAVAEEPANDGPDEKEPESAADENEEAPEPETKEDPEDEAPEDDDDGPGLPMKAKKRTET